MPFTAPSPGTDPERHAQRLPRRIHRLRTLGMGLAALPTGMVLLENQAGAGHWVFLLFTTVVWPQLALWLALRHPAPFRGEIRNLLVDSILAGMWVPLMAFNLLPSVLLVTLATVDKISTGIDRLWYWSLPLMLAGGIAAGLATGFELQPVTSMAVMIACLPMLLIHSIAVSQASYRLVRKVKRQNRQLDELSRRDTLTSLDSRRHWQERASALLEQCAATGDPATLLMIDIDHFKAINDQFGHQQGDVMLKQFAQTLTQGLRKGDVLVRWGGEEFLLLLPNIDCRQAMHALQRLRRNGFGLRPDQTPLTASIGVADMLEEGCNDWRQLIEIADQRMYAAKQQGRNRVIAGSEPAPNLQPALA